MNIPFRADQVGSLLRPASLAAQRAQFRRGEVGAATLKASEDGAIREAVRQQQAIGLQAITDGEFRRDWWHLDFLAQLDGVTLKANPGPKFKIEGQSEQPPIATVTGRIGCSRPIMAEHFAFLKTVTTRTAKMTIPSPSMLHLRGGRAAISASAYPDMAEFWHDVAAAYRVAIGHLYDAGCRYLQLDDITFAYLCDAKIQANCRANGDDPATLPHTYADVINAALQGRPADLHVTIHTCRGNFKSAWVAEGGYDPVVQAMFSTDVDGYFMEFDSARAGGFEPLRTLRDHGGAKKVVLGLVTTKLGELESKDNLKRRIDEASRFVPLDDLCLSPQCGFSSTHHGNALSQDDQWRKLERVVEVAREVWGLTRRAGRMRHPVLVSVVLLTLSNVFMTFAWYAHLKELGHKPWLLAALVSWGVAFFEYILQVPANRIGYTVLSVAQLKIMQEVITLSVFVPFAWLYLKEPLKLDYLWAGLCILGAVYFIFRSRLGG